MIRLAALLIMLASPALAQNMSQMGNSTGARQAAAERPAKCQWQPWFAVHPVWVDAYSEAERKNGKFRYRVWLRWVRRCFVTVVTSDPGDDETTWTGWKYRL